MFYRFINEEINRVVLVDRADVRSGRIIITHDNFDNTSAFGLELSFNYRPYKWWSINGSFDLYSQTQKGIAERLSKPIDVATKDDIETIINTVDNVATLSTVLMMVSISSFVATSMGLLSRSAIPFWVCEYKSKLPLMLHHL